MLTWRQAALTPDLHRHRTDLDPVWCPPAVLAAADLHLKWRHEYKLGTGNAMAGSVWQNLADLADVVCLERDGLHGVRCLKLLRTGACSIGLELFHISRLESPRRLRASA